MTWQDSFYHNLTEEEHTRVHDYNFDHPGEWILLTMFCYLWNVASNDSHIQLAVWITKISIPVYLILGNIYTY